MTNTPEGPEKAPEEKGNVVLRKNSLEGFKDTDGTENPSGDFIPYFPGREDVFQSLIRKYHFKTLKENETDKEAIFIYIEPEYKTEIKNGKPIKGDLIDPENCGIYTRDESYIKAIITKEYHYVLEDMLKHIETRLIQQPDDKNLTELKSGIIRKRYRIGITNADRTEIMGKIRVSSFVDRKTMNPESHIALLHGLLNMNTWETQPFTPTKFYTWKILGDYDPSINSLDQIPKFKDLLLQAFPLNYAETILDYLAYCYNPDFPKQLVLVMAGIHRRGKGTITRIHSYSMPQGYRSIELEKLLDTGNRFALQGIEGKKVLIDPEISIDHKHKPTFKLFDRLFGGDNVNQEEKFKVSHDITGKFAGILIGNIPLFHVDDSAFLSRLLIVVSNPEPITKDIPDLDKKIWEAEGPKIVSYLLNRLKSLVKREFTFSNQLTYEQYANLWELLSDTVKAFMDENFVNGEGEISRDDIIQIYTDWCRERKMIPEANKRLVYKFGKEYPLRSRWNPETKKNYKVFTNCSFSISPPKEDEQPQIEEHKSLKDELGL